MSSSEVSEASFFVLEMLEMEFWKWLPWSFEFVEMNQLQLEVYGLVKL